VAVPAAATSPQQLIINHFRGFDRRGVCSEKLDKLRETFSKTRMSRLGVQWANRQCLTQLRNPINHNLQRSIQQIHAERRMYAEG